MCQDEMEQVMEISERLLPTLDSNDTETLRQTLKQTNRRFNDVTTKSNRKKEMVELKIKEWKDYQVETKIYTFLDCHTSLTFVWSIHLIKVKGKIKLLMCWRCVQHLNKFLLSERWKANMIYNALEINHFQHLRNSYPLHNTIFRPKGKGWKWCELWKSYD